MKPDILWRPLRSEHLRAVAALAGACLCVDGGLPFAAGADFIRPRFLPPAHGAALGAFDPVGTLVAATAIRPEPAAKERRIMIAGLVHPDHRGQGIGSFMLWWSVKQGKVLLQQPGPDGPRHLVIETEGLTDAAAHLYARHGFAQEFAEDIMRRDLRCPLPEAPLPPGITLSRWSPEVAGMFFTAYTNAFKDRPGFPGWSKDQWIDWIADDDTFRPEASFVAVSGDMPAGLIVCDEGWVSQMGVAPAWRNRGLGAALIAAVLRHFHDAGTEEVFLDVNVNNPSAARLYARLGFQAVGRRARWGMEIA